MDLRGKATRINLFNSRTPQVRAFHMSWFAFFLCFFAWFGIAPLMKVVREEMDLTKVQIKELSCGQPCDISGIRDYRHLEAEGGIQWPFPAGCGDDSRERRLFSDGRFYHADGRARLLFDAPRPLPEQLTENLPLLLLTGRGSASQWHTQTAFIPRNFKMKYESWETETANWEQAKQGKTFSPRSR